VRFVEGKEWHLFVTIPIDDCPEDDELLRRLRRIEAELCKNYIAKRYHHLPDQHRFSMVVGIEGEQTKGTRHGIFDNKNLKVIRHRDRQRRKALFGRTNGKMPDK